jgi:hypothetical protein
LIVVADQNLCFTRFTPMSPMMKMSSSLAACLAVILSISEMETPAFAGGEFAQAIGAGAHFYTGSKTGSLTGSTGYSVNFGAEKSKGFFRPSLSAVLDYSAGTASFSSSSTSSYSLYGAEFLGGFKVFGLDAGVIEPFVGADGAIGSGTLKLPSAVGSTDANTLGFSYGFVLNMGVNIAYTHSGRAVRLQGQYWYLSSTMGGLTSFNLGGFRFALGLMF